MYHFTDRSTILGNHRGGVSTRFIAEKIEFQIDKCHCSPTYLPFHHLPDQTKLANGLGADKQDQKTILHIPSICFPSNPDASSFIVRFLLYQFIVDSVEFYFILFFFFWLLSCQICPMKFLFSLYLLELSNINYRPVSNFVYIKGQEI